MYNLQSEPTLYLAGLHHDILFQNQRRIEPSNNHVNGVIGDYYTWDWDWMLKRNFWTSVKKGNWHGGVDDDKPGNGNLGRCFRTWHLLHVHHHPCPSPFSSVNSLQLWKATHKIGALNREKYKSDKVMRAHDKTMSSKYSFMFSTELPDFNASGSSIVSCRKGTIVMGSDQSLAHVSPQLSESTTLSIVIMRFARGPHSEWHILDCMKSLNPLNAYDNWDNLNVCVDCVAYCKIHHVKGREEVWDRLPDFFGRNWSSLGLVTYAAIYRSTIPHQV